MTPRRWVVGAWVVLWWSGVALQLLPGQNTGTAVSDALSDGIDAAPSWLHGIGTGLAGSFERHGWLVVALVCAQAVVAGAAMLRGGLRVVSAVCGAALAAGFWMFGQGLGELTTGTSTDPNAAPLMVLLALAVAATARRAEPVPARAPVLGGATVATSAA